MGSYNGIEASRHESSCQTSQPACEIYIVSLALLGINFIACGIRVMYSLSIIREVGLLLIM